MAEAARTALILNANARHVTPRRAERLRKLANADHVYISRSLEEAEQVAQQVVDKGYDRVLSGGGDGTLVQVVNSICGRLESQGAPYPQLGVLRLGTGNAVASVIGGGRPEDDLVRLMTEPSLPTVPLQLIQSMEDGLDFPFAGIGYDGEILNDYLWFKENVKGPLLEEMAHSVFGYFAALFSRTLPRKMTEKAPPNVRVTTVGRAFYRDPADGDAMKEIAPGSVLYQGPAAMVSAATVPFYGFNFRMFPFAQDVPGMMQLRVVAMGPWTILKNLPAIWRGEHRDPDILDFNVEEVRVEGDAPLPYQIGGDARGWRDHLHFSMSPRQLQLVSAEPVTAPE
ncbi:MAG: diacylglycerol kinase [Deltaproteobacteria bacterium]|nr:diacylglycerol kinase [Deltaproteobacteria bacterium]